MHASSSPCREQGARVAPKTCRHATHPSSDEDANIDSYRIAIFPPIMYTWIHEEQEELMRLATKLAAVDLFCGAGGLSYGMKQAGIDISAGIDIDPACKHPFESNVEAKFHEQDVSDLSTEFVDSLFPKDTPRLLAGCAPCQPFSSYTNGERVREDDWRLLTKFGELVTALQPDVVTMENVPRLQRYPIFREFQGILDSARYNHDYHLVRCAEYGVPQMRRRLVLLASKRGKIELVPPTPDQSKFRTVRDAIQDLDRIEAGGASKSDPLHKSSGLSKRNLERIRSSKPGGTWRDWGEGLRADCHTKESGKTFSSVYGRMRWDELAPTITTQFNGFGNGRFGHPTQDRAISLREGALLQTFPHDYSFVPEGEDVRIATVARLIGNAVPVELGKAIGKSIMAHLEEIDDRP